MTLIDALIILNRFRHREYDQWFASDELVFGDGDSDNLTAFEAIAIARAYLDPVVTAGPPISREMMKAGEVAGEEKP